MSRLVLLPLLLLLPLSASAQFVEAPALPAPSSNDLDHLRDGGDVFLTHSNSLDVVSGGVLCWNAAGQWTSENNYWRVFDLPAEGVMGDLHIEALMHGVGTNNADNEQTFFFYSVDGDLAWDNLELLDSVQFTVTTDEAGTVNILGFDPAIVISAGTTLAVQIHIPHSQEQYAAMGGFNSEGQADATYIHSEDCNLPDPTPMGDLNPDWAVISWVLAVIGKDVTVSAEPGVEGRSVALGGAYPNPSTGMTTLPVELAEAQEVLITVHDLLGRQVSVVVDETLSAGSHFLQVDTRSLPSGTYVVRMVAGSTVLSNAIVSVR